MVLVLPGGVLDQDRARWAKHGLHPAYVRYVSETPAFFPLPLTRVAFASCSRCAADAVCLEMRALDDGMSY